MVPNTCNSTTHSWVAAALPVALGHPQHVGVGVGGHPLGVWSRPCAPALGLGRDRVVAEVLRERRAQRPHPLPHQRPPRRRRSPAVRRRPGPVASRRSRRAARRPPGRPGRLPRTRPRGARRTTSDQSLSNTDKPFGRGLGNPGQSEDPWASSIQDPLILPGSSARPQRPFSIASSEWFVTTTSKTHRPPAGALREALGAVRALRGTPAAPGATPRPPARSGRCAAAAWSRSTGAARPAPPARPTPRRRRAPRRPANPRQARPAPVRSSGTPSRIRCRRRAVGAPVEHGVRRGLAWSTSFTASTSARDIALNELVLQSQRRGGDHDPVIGKLSGTR